MKKLILVLVLFFIAGNIFAQSGWQWANPTPQGNNLNDCTFIDANNIYCAGNSGTILKSTDGGLNWTRLTTNTQENFIRIYFSNPSTGFVLSSGGYKMRTTNGGTNWITINNSPYGNIYDMDFLNENTGVITGSNSLSQTTNGGQNWISLGNYGGNGVVMLGINNIYIATNYPPMLHYTGNNQYMPVGNFPYTNLKDIDYYKNNPNLICACGSGGYISISRNGGADWESGNIVTTNMNRVKVLDSNNIIAIGDYSTIIKTTNAGLNWFVVELPNAAPRFNISGLNFSSSGNKGLICGPFGLLMSTSNSGSTWNLNSSVFSGEQMNVIRVLSENQIIAFGNNASRIICYDGAWTGYSPGSGNAHYTDAYFLNSLSGFAVRSYTTASGWPPQYYDLSIMDKTNDGGLSWNLASYYTTGYLAKSVCFTDNNTGYICGSKETILKTTNAGVNWHSTFPSASNTNMFYKIYFVNNNTGYATSDAGRVIKTTNAGNTWSNLPVPDAVVLHKIKFFDVNKGYVGGNSAYIYFTNDGGLNWNPILAPVNGAINSFYFFDESKGFVLGSNSVSYTSNGGNNWSTQNFLTNNILYDISFCNINTGYITGENGTIFKTTNGGNVFVSQISSNIPDQYLLKQNYPNPFNPSTRINYELKISNYVTLEVFDLLGKQVASLVNEKQNAGSYAVDFNSSEFNLPSGIYFYTLNAGEFKETKKMVLVK